MKQARFRRYLLAGLFVWIPVFTTFVLIRFLVRLMDGTLALLPRAYQPEHWLGFEIPGLGFILAGVIVLITGVIASNYFGRRLVLLGEAILDRIPLVRTIYKAVKQVTHTVFSSGSDSFRTVLLVEYPRKGLWSIAFQTSVSNATVTQKTGEEMLTIFIPTTPNPTSGFLMMIPKKEAIELDMSIDEALKMVISLGVVQPPSA